MGDPLPTHTCRLNLAWSYISHEVHVVCIEALFYGVKNQQRNCLDAQFTTEVKTRRALHQLVSKQLLVYSDTARFLDLSDFWSLNFSEGCTRFHSSADFSW